MSKVIAQVGLVVFTVLDEKLAVLVSKQGDCAELAQGLIDPDNDVDGEDAAARLLTEHFQIQVRPSFAGVIADAFRHDLGWSIGLIYAACVPASKLGQVLDSGRWSLLFENNSSELRPSDDTLAMIMHAKAWLAREAESGYTYANLIEPEFSIPEIHVAYELARGARKNRDSFRRTLRQHDVLEVVREVNIGTPTPLQIYRFKARS